MPPAKRKLQIDGTAVVPDTNVLIHDPKSIKSLKENGKTLIIPFVVIQELDKKKQAADIGMDAREALRGIEDLQLGGDKSMIIYRNPSFTGLGDLNRNVADHQIIATAKTLQQQKGGYKNVQLISKDRPVRILAREVGVFADDYISDQVVVPRYHLKELNVPAGIVDFDAGTFPYAPYEAMGIQENEGVVCHGQIPEPGEKGETFVAIRKGDHFKMIPDDIGAFGIKPFSLLNGNGENHSQYIALAQLLDPDVRLVCLQGGAGSGKTLLALATALQQKSSYRQIVVARPMIPLEDEDRMGFLPGDKAEKMDPWFRPIHQALNFLKDVSASNGSAISKALAESKVYFESLDYIRGTTFHDDIVIIDDVQNLTPHQMKTVVTRMGHKAKLILTGDLGQIDRKHLDERSSGLAHVIATMNNHHLVGVTSVKETVRSQLASLAEERM